MPVESSGSRDDLQSAAPNADDRRARQSFYLHSGPFEMIWIGLLVVMVLSVLALPLIQGLRDLIRQW